MVSPPECSDEWPEIPDVPAPRLSPEERAEKYRVAHEALSRVSHGHVDTILAMMRRGEWTRGVSGPQYAADRGLNPHTVKKYAAEAWRALTREVTDPRRVTEAISATLASTMQRAASKGDFGGVARVADVWSRVTGARAPERHEVAMVVADYERLPRDGKLTWLRERVAVLQDAIAALEASPVDVDSSPVDAETA